jgi:hypothetical protein
LIALAAYAAWSWIYPTYTYRYRMTVEVEADGKVHSGSSVVQVTYEIPPEWLLSANRLTPRVKGEAVFVDLGNGRNLIALLAAGQNADNVNYPYYIVPKLFGLTFSDEDLPKYGRLQDSGEIPASDLPTFVTFTDLNDPKTARVVEPYEFPEVFGEGVRFRGATIEMTRDAVTNGITEKLPWILTLKGYSGGQIHPDWSRPEKNLTGNQFIRGT